MNFLQMSHSLLMLVHLTNNKLINQMSTTIIFNTETSVQTLPPRSYVLAFKSYFGWAFLLVTSRRSCFKMAVSVVCGFLL
uniref:Putative secreted protein n=1 Tax=Panstrongylus lignarius TaxID=156445 RepID=A0A224XWL4_9HEMI